MSEHIVPVRIYILIFAALIVLTGVTTWVAFHDFGRWNTVVALAIAVTKMMLVILYFMHLRYSPGLTRMVVLVSVMFLALLIGITLTDALTRSWTPSPDSWGSPARTSSATSPSSQANP
jgi:cytochrome c oxidase subunit 4